MARGAPIPGVTGKRVPGRARLPRGSMSGFHYTRVPHVEPYTMSSDVFREFHRQQVRDTGGRFAGGWGFAWQGLDMVAENIEQYGIAINGNVRVAAQRLADEMVEWAKQNAPWTDHPGENRDARENLQGGVVWNGDSNFTIWLGHGADVYYGIWLEVRWGGRFAIILPTIYHFAPQIGDRIRTAT